MTTERDLKAIRLGWIPTSVGKFPDENASEGERYLVMRKGMVELCHYENNKWYLVNSNMHEIELIQYWKKIKCPNW